MIFKFKDTARIPKGVTADAVLAELDAIKTEHGRNGPDIATDAVMADPRKYPALRAFGPKSPKEAFRTGIRDGITYAIRAIVEDNDGGPEIRGLFLTTGDDGGQVYETIEIIAKHDDQRKQLVTELRSDAETFSRKMVNVLAEIERLMP